MKEKQIVGASYLYVFYQEVQLLTQHYSQYLNVMLELENKNKGTEPEKMSEEDKRVMLHVVQVVRDSVIKTYIKYTSLIEELNQEEDKVIKERYTDMEKQFIIDRLTVKSYVFNMNKFLLKGTLKELIQSSQDIVEKVFNNAT